MGRADLLEKSLRHFRSQRMRLLEKTFQISPQTRILDVGGSPFIWRYSRVRPRLTILNFPSAIERSGETVNLVAGDGRMLPFADGAFDIVFSNSVIEHVGGEADQRAFAEELARVGRRYWVQTPNRDFPIEAHLLLPFIHYFPKPVQRFVARRFTIWELLVRPDEAQRRYYVDHFLNELKLLRKRDLQRLFPGATILSERFLGLVKSNIAVRL